jgi:serine/threonine protein kinase/tetratricopeptide (TPR) repeat protein
MHTDFERIRQIFLAIVEKPSAEWESLLDEACGDAELRRQVAQLLKAHAEGVGILDRTGAGGAPTGACETLSECAGTVIGPYKLLQQIGEGGMGTVFMAEQTTPIRRQVALKVIKPGMDSRQIIARFEAERQALALMDHVNIARVLDAGSTESSRPYFVMELVHGVPITKYCDDNHLTPRERLELFVPVCQAIQHAHQKGIIHRDIKPSNVMITLYDGKPVPKVIDFGVAKAIEHKLTERTLFTQYGTMVGTLEYMSPEQAEMSALGVDTRSDVYSLGVLVYELLTGSTPLGHNRIKEAAFPEVLRMIKEEEPPRPSVRLSSTGAALATISAQRHMEPARLTKLVRGELDWIVMKSLEKDRNRRYETASAFALDVERYLRDEPVQACPPSAWYRFCKMARKNRRAFVSAVAVALTLVLAIVVLTVSYLNVKLERDAKEEALQEKETALEAKETALREKEKALREANRQKNIALFHLDTARVAIHDGLTSVAGNPRLKTADFHDLRKTLLRQSLPLLVAFAFTHEKDSETPDFLADVYSDLAFLHQEMGDYKQALEAYQKMRDVVARLIARFPDKQKYQLDLARAYHDAATILCELGRRAEAEPLYKEAVTLRKKVIEKGQNAPGLRHNLVLTYICLGLLCSELGRQPEALAYYDQALTEQQQLVKDSPKNAHFREGLAMTYGNRANLFLEMDQPQAAEAACQEAVTIQEQLVAEFSNRSEYQQQLATTYANLSNVKSTLRKREEAEAALAKAIPIQEKLVSTFPRVPAYRLELARSHANRGEHFRALGKPVEAVASFRQAVPLYEDLVKGFPKVPGYSEEFAFCCNNVGRLLLGGKPEGAMPWFNKAIAALDPVLAQEPKLLRARYGYCTAHWGRATVCNMLGRHDEALAAYDKAIEFDAQKQPVLHLERAMTLIRLKKYAQAMAEADAVAGARDATANVLYDAACVFALCAGAVKEAEQVEHQAARAVALLKRAVARGFKDVAHLKQDPDLAALRARNDYRDLLKELEAKKKE